DAAENPHGAPLAPEPFLRAEDVAGVVHAREQAAAFVERVTLPEGEDVFEKVVAQPRPQRGFFPVAIADEGGAVRGPTVVRGGGVHLTVAPPNRRRDRAWPRDAAGESRPGTPA